MYYRKKYKDIEKKLYYKYYTSPQLYNVLLVNNLIYDKFTKTVTKFKEDLIMTSNMEYLIRYDLLI
jgi:hypothetical protein